MRREVRLAGFGGQGIILAGYLLGKAAAVHDGKSAVLTQSYGPEARGGACSAELVVSDEPVDYPLLSRPDCLVLMSREAYERFAASAGPESVVIVDEDLVPLEVPVAAHRVPFTRMAEELGNRIVANVVMLGFLAAATGIVSRPALEEAVRSTVRERFVPLNLRALAAGFERWQAEAAAS